MIKIELPNTDKYDYSHWRYIYRQWFKENNIPYTISGKEMGLNDKVTLSEEHATLFKLRFG